jgi:hypothetical protein
MVAWAVTAIFSVKHLESLFCMACLILNKIMLVLGKRYTASLEPDPVRSYIEIVLSRTQRSTEYGVIDEGILCDIKGHGQVTNGCLGCPRAYLPMHDSHAT